MWDGLDMVLFLFIETPGILTQARRPCAWSIPAWRRGPTLAFYRGGPMARHHVISTTACDGFFKLVAHQKSGLGAHSEGMIVAFSADGQPVRGAALRDA